MIEKIKLGRISFSDACWEKISDNAKNLITKLIAFESNDRPSAEEALKHPWITEISIQQLDSLVAKDALQNLKKYRAEEKLKQATFAYIAS